MSTARGLLGEMIITGAGAAAHGALAGAVGAKILESAGYAGYSVLEATRMGAAGGAVLGAGVGFVSGLFVSRNKDEEQSKSFKELVGAIALTTGMSTVSGVLGHAMLNSIVEMPLEKIAAAMATGSGVVMGSLLAGFVVLGGCALCLTYSRDSLHSVNDNDNDNNNYRRMPGGPGGMELV